MAPKHNFVLATAFQLSAKEAKIYLLEILECSSIDGTPKTTIPTKYSDLRGAFSEEASNKLPNHGILDMRIEFKDGQEPCNTSLRPMSPIELEEL